MRAYDAADPEHSKRKSQISYNGGALYIEKFDMYVEWGQDLPVGTDKEHSFLPLTEDQETTSFDVLVTK